MRKQKIYLVLATAVLMLFLIQGCRMFEIYKDYSVPVDTIGRRMGMAVVDNLDFLEGKEKRNARENPGVVFDGVLLPYDRNGTLYLAQDFQVEVWEGDILTDSEDTFLCTLPDEAWEEKAASISEGHVFHIWLVGEEYYYPLELVVSGMPVMSISTKYLEEQDLGTYEEDPDRFYFEPDTLYYGNIQVFDPGDENRSYDIFESQVRYNYRGATSSGYDKKSYSISLLNAKGEKRSKSLLGMRSDNSWKLKSLAADATRIREKSACEIWEQIADANTLVNEAGPRMEYLELIIDNEYVGLYGIVEPVDEKKLDLDKNDVLYKNVNWILPEDEDIQSAVDKKWRIMSFIRIRYPDSIQDYAKVWHPMRDYLNTFYRGLGDSYPIESKLYLSNAADMHIFLMTVSGSDNYYKNMYFAADVAGDGSYTMRLIPWDLDLTFGSVARDGKRMVIEDVTDIYGEQALAFLKGQQPELVRHVVKERWQEYRETFLSTDRIIGIIRGNQQYLLDSGVTARENARWEKYQMDTDIENMVDFQERRMEFLDEYFEEY